MWVYVQCPSRAQITSSPSSALELALVPLGGENDVVLELENGLVVALERLEVDDQVGLDGEDGVGGEPGVVVGVELGGAALELGVRNHDVNVSGPHGVAVHEGEQIPRGPVLGQAVGGGVQAVEPVAALLVGAELATEVVGRLVIGVLEVVLAVGRRLPDVEDGTGDRLAGDHVTDHTVHLGHAALGRHAVLDDGATELAEGSVGRPEGAQDGRGRGVDVALGDDLVGDLINKAKTEQSARRLLDMMKTGGGGVFPRGTYDSRPRVSEMRWASFRVCLLSA